MPALTSDDDVLAYRPRWLGPHGVASFRLGIYYEALFTTYAWWPAESIVLGVTVLASGVHAALLVALVLHALIVALALRPGRRALGVMAGLFVATASLQLPILAVVLAPFLHAPMVGGIVARLVDSDRSLGEWRRVLSAEAAAPRYREPQPWRYRTGPAPFRTDKAPSL